MLYEELRRSVPHLANLLLMTEEDKTKANAAGALSNLVRNSDKLCEDIVSKGAIQVCDMLHCQFMDTQMFDLHCQISAFITLIIQWGYTILYYFNLRMTELSVSFICLHWIIDDKADTILNVCKLQLLKYY